MEDARSRGFDCSTVKGDFDRMKEHEKALEAMKQQYQFVADTQTEEVIRKGSPMLTMVRSTPSNRAERRAQARKPKGSGPKIQKKRWVRT